jgi:hypothetical protein
MTGQVTLVLALSGIRNTLFSVAEGTEERALVTDPAYFDVERENMATRRELIERVQKVADFPGDDFPALRRQVKMLAQVILALEKHHRQKEEVLELLVKKTKQLVGVLNSVRGSQPRLSTTLKAETATSEIISTIPLKPLEKV